MSECARARARACTDPGVVVVVEAVDADPVEGAQRRVARVDPEVVALAALDLNRLDGSRHHLVTCSGRRERRGGSHTGGWFKT